MSLKKCLICKKQAHYGPDESGQRYCIAHKLDCMQKIEAKKCGFLDCKGRANYGPENGLGTFYCGNHRSKDLIDHSHKKCISPNCKKFPTFNIDGQIPLYCADHKTVEMVNMANKSCIHENCKTIPNFNLDGLPARYCLQHKSKEMVNVKANKCKNCPKVANFNFDKFKTPIYCFDHKLEGMVNINAKHCLYCDTVPCFNYIGEIDAICCAEHKMATMINVKDRTCAHNRCLTIPNFNMASETTGLYCFEHKLAGMTNVKSKHCLEFPCRKQPIFNNKGETSGIYCSKHRKENMVNVVSKKCEYENCYTTARYNIESIHTGIYCFIHKTEDMIDVMEKRCVCKKQPNYGFIGYTPTHCTTCKIKGMVRDPIKRCGCGKLATKIKETVYYCDDENIKDAIDIHEICNICYNKTEIGKQVCNSCIIQIETPKTHHLKELQIKRYLENAGIEIHSYDKIVGESKRRPDFIIKQSDNNIIVIECDEFQHQHKSYPCECEITRMKQIYFDLFKLDGSKDEKIRDGPEDARAAGNYDDEKNNKLLFIRYNPDQYLSEFPQISTIKRLEYFEKYIDNFNFDEMDINLGVKYLFYDHFIPGENLIDIVAAPQYQLNFAPAII
jgi:hypothetical protein